ncbi:MAG: SGNH/GDSL hydrolase family protein, partial [Acidobacteria bacterium]|nr:SGNH/GDSL hydrolase family protein [Acidobacteriota bacterium]
MRTKTSSFILALLLLLSVGQALPVQSHWVGTWAASQQRPEPQNALSKDDLHDATLRQIIHLSLGGSRLRVHLSNRFGTAPFHIASAHVARAQSRDSGTIITASDKALTFSGSADLTIPAGAEYVSDPLVFSARAFSDLAITLS